MSHLKGKTALRRRILSFLGGFIILSLLGFALSLYRITDVNHFVDGLNRFSIPLGRTITALLSDAEVYDRELERSLGVSHWKDPRWRAREVPPWVHSIIEDHLTKLQRQIEEQQNASLVSDWIKEWVNTANDRFLKLKETTQALLVALQSKSEAQIANDYPKWIRQQEDWKQHLKWGAETHEKSIRNGFNLVETRLDQLHAAIQMILASVVALSFLLFWLGDRALRPLHELTIWVRDITQKGFHKSDRDHLPKMQLYKDDEISELGREFYRLATALSEREKIVTAQQTRLQEQNKLLIEMGELNETVLKNIQSVLLVTDLSDVITQCNPFAEAFLNASKEKIVGSLLRAWEPLQFLNELSPADVDIPKQTINHRLYQGKKIWLKEESGEVRGMILTLEDVTESTLLEERLIRAENLAAVGRLSAQVAHEVRNPLHSIGLEAEMALEWTKDNPNLKQSIKSILQAVDRLEAITENYLRLSRLSAGVKKRVDLREVVESILASYSSVFEHQQIQISWSQPNYGLWINGDRSILEQAIGNIIKNAIQALAEVTNPKEIQIQLSQLESGKVILIIKDNGPGIEEEIREKLFTPFITTKAQGTGLGLSFLKQVLDDHHASVSIRSDTEQGACFEMSFQVDKSEREMIDDKELIVSR